jgi:N-formylglutamate deformylase
MSQDHINLSDSEFLTQFENCRLPASSFSHEAHIRLAWLMLKKHGLDEAIRKVSTQIEAYVTHLGATDKYHKTLTVAAVLIVNHFVELSSTSNFNDFITENPRLLTEFKKLVLSHYSVEIFNSDSARLE